MYNRSFFHTAFEWAFHTQKRAHTCRRVAGFAYLCDNASRTSPRAGRRAGPPRVPSRQTGLVAEEANEKVRFESRKGPRSAESARISAPSTTRIWICYVYVPGTYSGTHFVSILWRMCSNKQPKYLILQKLTSTHPRLDELAVPYP